MHSNGRDFCFVTLIEPLLVDCGIIYYRYSADKIHEESIAVLIRFIIRDQFDLLRSIQWLLSGVFHRIHHVSDASGLLLHLNR